MTDHDLEFALKDLTKSVTDQRYELGVKLAVITTNVGTLQTAHDENTVKLDKVLALELSCPARAGFKGTNARLSKLETTDRVRIESELQQARDEITGQQDVERTEKTEATIRRRFGDNGGTFFKALVWKALPYVLFGCVALGAYLVSGGDTDATTRALRAVSDAVARVDGKIEKVEKKVDEVVADTDQTDEEEPGVPMAPLPAAILP